MKTMKTNSQIIFGCAILATLVGSSCTSNKTTKDDKADSVTTADTAVAASIESAPKGGAADTSKKAFNINDIPLTTKDIGLFPYVKAPEGYKFNDITKSDLAIVHFPVNGLLVAVEGKKYSTNIYKINEGEGPFNMLIVEREYDKVIKELGGVKVSSKLLPGQVEKVGVKLLEAEGDHAYTIIGANDYTLNHVNTYVIRTEKVQVWIELSFYQNGGYIYILQKEN